MNQKHLRYVRQNRKKIGVSIVILIFLIALGIFILYAIQSDYSLIPLNKTVYVTGDGSGNFTCDGSDDQVEINQALAYVAKNRHYSTVYLKGPNTYVISDSILIGSDTVLEGDSTAVIKLKDKAGWQRVKPLITQMDNAGIRGVTIKGFEINGNHDNNQDKNKGEGYYNMIHFLDSKNIQVHDMYLHDGHGDGLKVEKGSNIQFYNNKVYKLGHDGLYVIDCQNIEAWDNTITCRTNSGLRIWNSNHIKFHDNVIDSFFHWSAGGPGILIEKSTGIVNDVEIYNNTIYNTYGPGIWLIGYGESYPREEAQNVHIHHNTFYNTGTNPSIDWVGGVVTSGFYDTLIENNVFDGIYHAAIINMYPSVSTGTGDPSEHSPQGTGYTTIIRNNIIINTQKRTENPEGTGYAVINYLPETHTFVLENNCLYNNVGGNYKNANSTTDIYVAPLFADLSSHDYHLKSVAGRWNGNSWVKDSTSSPCIDAGAVSSDYSNEPEDNGNRINIGRYGNTIYASLSGTAPETTPDDAVSEETTVSEVEVYDNRLREASSSTVDQSSLFSDVGGMSTGRYRDIIGFDLSEYANLEEVSNAILSLYWYYPSGTSRPEDTVIEVYRPASSWDSSYVSWDKRESGVAWNNAGGDWYDKNGVSQGSIPYATITIKGSALPDNRYYELDVTDLVKEYVSGKYENTGLLIKARSESNNYIAFYSNDVGNTDQAPKLQLIYS